MTSEPKSVPQQLEEAIRYLMLAHEQLLESRRWVRLRRLERLMLRPLALFRNIFLLGALTFALWCLRWNPWWAFSLVVFVVMTPQLWLVWRARGGEALRGFLKDVHYSDEVIMEMGSPHLLEWPTLHPELAMEEGAKWEELLASTLDRIEQLRGALGDLRLVQDDDQDHLES